MGLWFTSDTHFGHQGILSPKMTARRYFDSIEEHDETLVANWNALIRPKDVVWFLGDFAYKCTEDHARKIFGRLNGVKHLVIGNHEKLGRRLPWASQQDVAHVVHEGQGLWLSHYAHRTWPRLHRGDLHLYGHSHGSLPGTAHSCDVGVDSFSYYPVNLGRIRDALMENAARIEEELALGVSSEPDQDGPDVP